MYPLFYLLFVLVILGAVYYYVLQPMGVKLPGLRGFGRKGSIKGGGVCPFCSSDDIFYSTKRKLWTCNDCKEAFLEPKIPKVQKVLTLERCAFFETTRLPFYTRMKCQKGRIPSTRCTRVNNCLDYTQGAISPENVGS